MLVRGNVYNRPLWHKIAPSRFNMSTRESHTALRDYVDGDGYLLVNPGMLMGMHNALSSTIGAPASSYQQDQMVQVATLRSSDDGTTGYIAPNCDMLAISVLMEIRALKLLGINLSQDKTFYFPFGFSEYTSWYMDGAFVSQYGVETSTLRPQGKNPPDDFHNIAITAAVAQQTQQRLEINTMGAEAKIRIGIDNCRRLWRIVKGGSPRHGISPAVQVLSDGGLNPFNCSLCHIEETAIKKLEITNDAEQRYMDKIRSQFHPFSAPPSEEITYSVDRGALVTVQTETPRTPFNFIKGSNRTNRGTGLANQAAVEKIHNEAVQIVETADVTTMIRHPSTPVSMAAYVINMAKEYRSNCVLTPEETDQYEQTLKLLGGEFTMSKEEATDYDLNF